MIGFIVFLHVEGFCIKWKKNKKVVPFLPKVVVRLAQSSVPEGQLLADLVDPDEETRIFRVVYYIALLKSSDFRIVSLKTIMDGRILTDGSKKKLIGMMLSATCSSIKGIA